jgi:hypothetical protein
MLTKNTATFVSFSDISAISEEIERALQVLTESSPDWSWGTNNKTLIDVGSFLNEIESALDGEDDFYYKDSDIDEQTDGVIFIEDIIETIRKNIPKNVNYVDLEN